MFKRKKQMRVVGLCVLGLLFGAAAATTQAQDEPLADFEIIEQRNIFRPKSEERPDVKTLTRDPKAPQAGPVQSTADSGLILTGVIKLRSQYKAIIENAAGGKSFYVKVGDPVEDFTVTAITDQTIVLERNAETFTLRLLEKKAAAANPPAATPALAPTAAQPDVPDEELSQNDRMNRLRTGNGHADQ